ncbi:hypothetical protein THMIRHAM_02060 [Thiomicrorhabdus immobilis]|uniref:Uncharacterized protein n=1 Tax=Thiomicrorhabdus immobilis TaxID=2791037 RepID=A0ABM7MAQ5_9GAMM|nr:hypothetical protein [Thiomicrorhabdus immobilis]BCN92421.1 hypothetical protein THMIRHAM_02060 [Thiomicrorhabdus immobilis]
MSKPSQTKHTPKKLPVFWILFFISTIGFSLMLLIQPDREPVDTAHLPWNSSFDGQGKLHALGLTLHKSTLSDAMALYGKDVEVKLFSDKDESNKSLEAYFPVIYIGSIKAGLTLKLEATNEELENAYSNGKKTSLTTSGEREVELYTSEIAKFFNSPISSMALIPRNNLTERAIDKRFGQPDRKEIQSDGLAHWFFDKLGLELIIDAEGPEALQYTSKQ